MTRMKDESPSAHDGGGLNYLAATDALYRSLLEQFPAVVYVDSNELVSESPYVSPQCEAMLGIPAEAFVADRRLWATRVHPDDLDRVHADWVAAYGRQDRFESEYRWIKPDGTVIWVRDGSVLVRDDRGEPLFWQGLMHDITESKRAEDALRVSEARYRLLVENIPAVVYMVAPDDDRRTLYVNPQVERTLGYTRKEWLQQPDIWMELLHPDDREPTLDAHDRANLTGNPWSREYRLIASDGRALWFRDVGTLVRDEHGAPLHWLGVQLDITELKLVEDELRAARDELEERVAERTAALEETNEMMSLEIAERRRAEEDLRATEQRYRLLAENIPAVTYTWQRRRRGDSTHVHESAHRADARVHVRGVGTRGLLDVTAPSGRSDRGARGHDPLGEHRRALLDGVPLPPQGRPHRVGAGRGGAAVARQPRTAGILPRGHARRHRAEGG